MFAKTMMRVAGVLVLAVMANAHFQMQFPVPRGPFVEDNEPNFCDSYTNAVSNRSTFPLDNGFITINSEHPQWTAAVLISIDQNPTNFTVFNVSSTGVHLPLAVPFFQASGEGAACIPIDIGKLGISGVQDGSNVTVQVEFNGGDGSLFQCADLTLSSNFSIPSNVSCTHVVGNATTTSTSGSTSPTTTAPAGGSSNAAASMRMDASGLLGAVGAVFLALV